MLFALCRVLIGLAQGLDSLFIGALVGFPLEGNSRGFEAVEADM